MRKIMIVALFSIILAGCEKESVLADVEIPEEVISYVDTHFPENPIAQVVKDIDEFELSYDVLLEGSYSLEFNRKKQIISVKGLSKLPDSVVPDKLLDYVLKNYPSQLIFEWSLDDREQEIKLDNELELIFNLKDEFKRIDY